MASVRGAARKVVELKRLPDGTFAPKGRGEVLRPGVRVSVPHKSGKGTVTGVMKNDRTVALTSGPDQGKNVDLKPQGETPKSHDLYAKMRAEADAESAAPEDPQEELKYERDQLRKRVEGWDQIKNSKIASPSLHEEDKKRLAEIERELAGGKKPAPPKSPGASKGRLAEIEQEIKQATKKEREAKDATSKMYAGDRIDRLMKERDRLEASPGDRERVTRAQKEGERENRVAVAAGAEKRRSAVVARRKREAAAIDEPMDSAARTKRKGAPPEPKPGTPEFKASQERHKQQNLERYGKEDAFAAQKKPAPKRQGAPPEPKPGTPEFDAMRKRHEEQNVQRYGKKEAFGEEAQGMVKDAPIGSTVTLADGKKYVLAGQGPDPWMVAAPVDGGRAKPINKMAPVLGVEEGPPPADDTNPPPFPGGGPQVQLPAATGSAGQPQQPQPSVQSPVNVALAAYQAAGGNDPAVVEMLKKAAAA